MNAFRVSRPFHLVALLALIAQLLLPMSHAAAMEQRGGDPLMVAFCGSVSPQSLQRLRLSAPPELLQAIAASDAAGKRETKAPCSFCAGLASVQHAALPSSPSLVGLLPDATVSVAPTAGLVPASVVTRPPPARGPPVFS